MERYLGNSFHRWKELLSIFGGRDSDLAWHLMEIHDQFCRTCQRHRFHLNADIHVLTLYVTQEQHKAIDDLYAMKGWDEPQLQNQCAAASEESDTFDTDISPENKVHTLEQAPIEVLNSLSETVMQTLEQGPVEVLNSSSETMVQTLEQGPVEVLNSPSETVMQTLEQGPVEVLNCTSETVVQIVEQGPVEVLNSPSETVVQTLEQGPVEVLNSPSETVVQTLEQGPVEVLNSPSETVVQTLEQVPVEVLISPSETVVQTLEQGPVEVLNSPSETVMQTLEQGPVEVLNSSSETMVQTLEQGPVEVLNSPSETVVQTLEQVPVEVLNSLPETVMQTLEHGPVEILNSPSETVVQTVEQAPVVPNSLPETVVQKVEAPVVTLNSPLVLEQIKGIEEGMQKSRIITQENEDATLICAAKSVEGDLAEDTCRLPNKTLELDGTQLPFTECDNNVYMPDETEITMSSIRQGPDSKRSKNTSDETGSDARKIHNQEEVCISESESDQNSENNVVGNTGCSMSLHETEHFPAKDVSTVGLPAQLSGIKIVKSGSTNTDGTRTICLKYSARHTIGNPIFPGSKLLQDCSSVDGSMNITSTSSISTSACLPEISEGQSAFEELGQTSTTVHVHERLTNHPSCQSLYPVSIGLVKSLLGQASIPSSITGSTKQSQTSVVVVNAELSSQLRLVPSNKIPLDQVLVPVSRAQPSQVPGTKLPAGQLLVPVTEIPPGKVLVPVSVVPSQVIGTSATPQYQMSASASTNKLNTKSRTDTGTVRNHSTVTSNSGSSAMVDKLPAGFEQVIKQVASRFVTPNSTERGSGAAKCPSDFELKPMLSAEPQYVGAVPADEKAQLMQTKASSAETEGINSMKGCPVQTSVVGIPQSTGKVPFGTKNTEAVSGCIETDSPRYFFVKLVPGGEVEIKKAQTRTVTAEESKTIQEKFGLLHSWSEGSQKHSEKDKYKYYCAYCNHSYANEANLERHKQKGLCTRKCKYCGKMFYGSHTHKEKYRRHIADHEGIRYNCDFCRKQYRDKQGLTVHIRTHTGEKPFSCNKCDAQFTNATACITHKQNKHTNEKKHQCDLCGALFKQLCSLKHHNKSVHSEVQLQVLCSVCNKTFKTEISMKQHYRICHTVLQKKFTCKFCNKNFRQKSYCTNHEKRHTKEFKFFCDTCGKGFYGKTTLRLHLRIHSGEKPVRCSICSYCCANPANMIKHMKRHERGKISIPYSQTFSSSTQTVVANTGNLVPSDVCSSQGSIGAVYSESVEVVNRLGWRTEALQDQRNVHQPLVSDF